MKWVTVVVTLIILVHLWGIKGLHLCTVHVIFNVSLLLSLSNADPMNLSRFLFSRSPSCQVGKHDEAWMILKQIHDTNMRARGQPEKVFTVSVCLCCTLSWLAFLMLKEVKRLILCHCWDRFHQAGSYLNYEGSESSFVSFRLKCCASCSLEKLLSVSWIDHAL